MDSIKSINKQNIQSASILSNPEKVKEIVSEVINFSNNLQNLSRIKELFDGDSIDINYANIVSYSIEDNIEFVTLNDGSVYAFKDGTLYDYKHDNCHVVFMKYDSKHLLNNLYDVKDEADVDYTATISINSHIITDFYSLGNKDIDTKQMALNFAEQYKNYSDYTLDHLKFSSGGFAGIVCSSWELSSSPDRENHAGAYAAKGKNGTRFIYIPVGDK